MNVFYSESKTDLKLWCDSCMNSSYSGCQEIISRFTAVCRMLLSHNPYRLPQHYKRHVCGPICSCRHRYLWVSPIFDHYFCLNYVGTVHHRQPFSSTTRVHFIGQRWYFNPQWTSEQAIIKARSVSQLRKMRSQEVSTYISVFVKGLRRCRGYILAPEWKPDLQGSCHIASHST